MEKAVFITSIIVLSLLFLGIGGVLVYFSFTTPEQIVGQIPATCTIESEVTNFGTYTCPSQSSFCDVTIFLECKDKISDPRVVFRGSAQQGLPSEISVDSNNDGSLEPYSRSSGTSICSTQNVITYLPEPYQGNYVFERNGDVRICNVADNKGYLYVDGGSISIQNTPLSNEKCDGSLGFIRCAGDTNNYQCSEETTGSKKILVSYSGSVEGTSQKSFSLNGGETIGWDGKIISKESKVQNSECTKNIKANSASTYYACIQDEFGCGVIDYSEVLSCGSGILFNEVTGKCEAPTTCVSENGDILNKGEGICLSEFVLERCVMPPETQKEYVENEGELCINGVIQKAYDVEVSIERLVIAQGENFKIVFQLKNTDLNKNIQVDAKIIGTGISQSRLTGSNYFDAGKAEFNLPSPSQGFYTLQISMDHPLGYYEKTYQVQVTSGLGLNLFPENPIQFDNDEIVVQLEAFKGGDKKRLTSHEIQAEFNGKTVFPSATEPVGKDLRFYYNLKGDGILRVRAKGSDETGLTTDWTDWIEVTIKETGIEIVTDFKSGVCAGTIKNSFKTRDSTGNLVDTTNQILVRTPLSGKTDTVTPKRSSLGEYDFNYDFSENGLYVIEVTSNHPILGTYELNDGLGEGVTILTGAGCGSGGDPTDGPQINYVFWFIIIAFVLGIGVFIYLIFIRGRR